LSAITEDAAIVKVRLPHVVPETRDVEARQVGSLEPRWFPGSAPAARTGEAALNKQDRGFGGGEASGEWDA
jgi:hypothetical protein